MKQHELIQYLRKAAECMGKTIDIRQTRQGIRLSTPGSSINLGPDLRQDVSHRLIGRYTRRLGLECGLRN